MNLMDFMDDDDWTKDPEVVEVFDRFKIGPEGRKRALVVFRGKEDFLLNYDNENGVIMRRLREWGKRPIHMLHLKEDWKDRQYAREERDRW